MTPDIQLPPPFHGGENKQLYLLRPSPALAVVASDEAAATVFFLASSTIDGAPLPLCNQAPVAPGSAPTAPRSSPCCPSHG